jgi:peptidoglycan-associated lipoprotein
MARPRAIALRDVHFGFDSAKLSPTAKQALKEDFENLGLGQENLGAKLVLEGRADERGSDKYNQILAQRRIASVRSYLQTLGAKDAQFQSRDLGEREPLAEGSNPDAWAKNRSVRVLAM